MKALSAESALLQRRVVSLLVLQQTVVNETINVPLLQYSVLLWYSRTTEGAGVSWMTCMLIFVLGELLCIN